MSIDLLVRLVVCREIDVPFRGLRLIVNRRYFMGPNIGFQELVLCGVDLDLDSIAVLGARQLPLSFTLARVG